MLLYLVFYVIERFDLNLNPHESRISTPLPEYPAFDSLKRGCQLKNEILSTTLVMVVMIDKILTGYKGKDAVYANPKFSKLTI